MGKFQDYQTRLTEDIRTQLGEMQVQPVLFAGSGLSIRHFGGPSWDELLAAMVDICPLLKEPYESYLDRFGDQIHVAEHFAEHFSQWAKKTGERTFPRSIRDEVESSSELHGDHIFLKYKIATHLESITPSSIDATGIRRKAELRDLQAIQPHTIVTTNYDTFLNRVFPDYVPIVGDQILRSGGLPLGEVFQIHGSVSDPKSLVATARDYERFRERRQYLTAKLLVFFVEHPVLFVGYSHNDPNIRDILRDVAKVAQTQGRVIPNVYVVDWRRKVDPAAPLESDVTIEVETHRHVRVKRITTSSLDWVYQAFSSAVPVDGYRVKPLRALLARVTNLVREDVPTRRVEVDFQTLQSLVDDNAQLDRILGVTRIGDGGDFNLNYRHTLTDVGIALGFTSWHGANALLTHVHEETGIDLKASDNRYHMAVKVGRSPAAVSHKYSDALVALLQRVKDEQNYELDLGED